MSKYVLQAVSDCFDALSLQYGFMTYGGNEFGEIEYPYFVGEYIENESISEDGHEETEFIINGFTRKTWLELEEAKEQLKEYFHPIYGRVIVDDDGAAANIMFAGAMPVEQEDEELKRIQITLTINEWRVK